jgi:hypothetical protein
VDANQQPALHGNPNGDISFFFEWSGSGIVAIIGSLKMVAPSSKADTMLFEITDFLLLVSFEFRVFHGFGLLALYRLTIYECSRVKRADNCPPS